MNRAEAVIAFLRTLLIAEGPLAGQQFEPTPEHQQWLRGFLADGITVGCLSQGRGGGKTTMGSALSVAFLLGVPDPQPRRVIEIYARTRDQARIAYSYASGLILSLPDKTRKLITVTKPPRLEIRYEPEDGSGPHYLRVASSDSKSALGGAPVFVLGDERGFWPIKGDELEETILSSLAKRGGRYAMISTSAPDDTHEFSKWLDEPGEGTYCQEHKAPPDLPLDDEQGLLAANPGCKSGVGPQLPDLLKSARRAIQRGGYAEQKFRLLVLNQRVPSDDRAVVLTVQQFQQCETDTLPERAGPCVVGVDLGESQSMSCASYFWYETGRLETHGWFPTEPGLADRGAADRVGTRYLEMQQRGELSLLGGKVVPVSAWIREVLERVHGSAITCIVADRFRRSLLEEGVQQSGFLHLPIVYRANGWYHGGEDLNRFRSAALDGEVQTLPNLMLRSALADAVVQRDDGGNVRLSKSKSVSRIDALSAAVLAIAHGQRLGAQPAARAPRVAWA